MPGEDLGELRVPRPDLLIVPGGEGSRRADPELVGWLPHARQANRLVSVCTGAFLLAEAGLLDGRRVTTHWSYCGALAAKYPQISVEEDPIFVRDGNVATLAGVTAGIDLALALVEDDLGRDAALDIARHLVVFLRRPGNQAQFSAQLAGQLANRVPLRDVQRWIADHPAADLSVEALASQASLSPRQFARAFAAEVGCRRDATSTGSGSRRRAAVWRTPRRSRADRSLVRLRYAGGDAPRLHPRPRREPRRVPPPLPPRSVHRRLRLTATRLDLKTATPTDQSTEESHADRHPAFRPVHRPRRDRPLPGPQRLPGAEVSFVAEHPEPIGDEVGSLVLSAQAGLPDVPHPDIVVVPGGPGQDRQMQDGAVHEWLRTADQTSAWITLVCTGSLILAAAGLLAGRCATSHWLALDELGAFGVTPVSERVVFDGKYVTAAGVSSGIDMGLALAGASPATRQPGHPAHDRIRPAASLRRGLPGPAPAEIVRTLRARSRFHLTGRRPSARPISSPSRRAV